MNSMKVFPKDLQSWSSNIPSINRWNAGYIRTIEDAFQGASYVDKSPTSMGNELMNSFTA